MTQTQNTYASKQGNVLGITKIQTADGTAKAVMSTRRVTLTTAPIVNETKSGNGWFLSARFNIYGEHSIRRLKFGLNDAAAIVEDQYGVGVRMSVYIKSKAQMEYLQSQLVKGSKIDGLHGMLSVDPKHGVQYNVQASDIGFINKPGSADAEDDIPSDEVAGDVVADDEFVV
jgi:hypothetical protein